MEKQPRTQLPVGRIPTLRLEPMPRDTNQHGDIFGGWVMSQVDLAGGEAAMRYALTPKVVTRAVSSFTFEHPITVGDIVSLYADIMKVGNTSLTVKVDVYAEHITRGRNLVDLVTEAELVYVCLGPDDKPLPVKESRRRYFAAHPEDSAD